MQPSFCLDWVPVSLNVLCRRKPAKTLDSLNLLRQPCLTRRGLRLTPTSPRIRKWKRWRHHGKWGGTGRHNKTIVYQNLRYLIGSAPRTLPVFACARDLLSSAHLLRSLHWLPVKERIMFKILLFVFINFSNGNHQVIFLKISPCTTQMDLEVAGGSALLLTSPGWLFHIPKGRPGNSSFFVAASKSWNKLPGCHQGSGIHCHLQAPTQNSPFPPAYDLLVWSSFLSFCCCL